MNKTLKLLTLLIIILLFSLTSVSTIFAATNIPQATSDFYVNDFAQIFTENEKSKLMADAVSLANECDGIQVVVTTIKSLEGDTIENYAYQMYNEYAIGKDDMGLLILLATEDRQIRVEVGRSMEAYINDAKAGRYMDEYAIPYLRENKFNEGLINLQQALITEIKSCVVSVDTNENNGSININIDWGAVFFVFIIIIATGAVIWFIIFIVIRVKKKREEKQEYINKLNQEIEELNIMLEKIVSKHAQLKSQNDTLKSEKNKLQEELDAKNKSLLAIDSRYKLILHIYPDADKKVDEMIEAEKVAKAKGVAHLVDELIASVINLQPDKNLLTKLTSIKQKIDKLKPDEVKYVQSDMDKFNCLYNKCVMLKKEYDRKVEEERIRQLTEKRKAKAKDITEQLLAVISMIGIAKASDLSELMDAKELYEDLDNETRSYVNSSAISKIEELIRHAKRDKQEQEEEEERKRRQALNNSMNSSRMSSSSHSSFGGFGGRSGGGGASRKF